MSLFHIPLYVKARTEEELKLEILRVQARDGVTYKFFSVVFDGEFFTAWYHGDASVMMKDKLKDLSQPKVNVDDAKKNTRRPRVG